MPHRFAERPNLPVSGVNGQKQKLTISKTAVKQSSGRPLVTGLNKLERGACCQPDTKKQAEKSTPTGRMKSEAPSCEASFSDQCARSLTLPERPGFHSSEHSKEMEACEYATIFSTGKPFNTFEPFCVSNSLHFEISSRQPYRPRRPRDPSFTVPGEVLKRTRPVVDNRVVSYNVDPSPVDNRNFSCVKNYDSSCCRRL